MTKYVYLNEGRVDLCAKISRLKTYLNTNQKHYDGCAISVLPSVYTALSPSIIYVEPDPTFPLNVAMKFCRFDSRYSHGPRYTVGSCGIFAQAEQWVDKGVGINPEVTGRHRQNNHLTYSVSAA